MVRVNPAHRKDASICKTYEELLEDVKAFIREGYKTVVIDTGGSLVKINAERLGNEKRSFSK